MCIVQFDFVSYTRMYEVQVYIVILYETGYLFHAAQLCDEWKVCDRLLFNET